MVGSVIEHRIPLSRSRILVVFTCGNAFTNPSVVGINPVQPYRLCLAVCLALGGIGMADA